MKAEPLGQRIILKAKKADEVTSFGLVLPEQKEKPMQAEVVSVSKEVKDSTLKVGDLVLYKKYSPTEFNLEGEDYLVIEAEDILAKIS